MEIQGSGKMMIFLKMLIRSRLSQEESQLLDAKITYREATDSLKHMNNDTNPGSNGFTIYYLKRRSYSLPHKA